MPSLQNFLDKLNVYREIFTEVRLIDLSQIIETGENIYISCACRDIDGICRTCKNCIAVKAASDNSSKIKWEYINSEIHQITVTPTIIDGKKYVIEFIQKLDADSQIDSKSSEVLVDKLTVYKDKLYKDVITGIYNRHYYEDRLKNVTATAGVAVIDINDFRLYNEAFGHHVGDIILNTVAQAISHSLNKSDVLVRYGGDEFLVIFNDTKKEDFYHKLTQLSDLVRRIAVPGYSQVQLSVCIGGIYADSLVLSDAVTKADAVMLQGKANGKNVVTDCQDLEDELSQKQEKQKILLVDDSRMNRHLLMNILSDSYEIIEATDGKQALDILDKKKGEIALMLLDIVMPVMDGFEVLSRMASNHLIEDIPVIMISSEDASDTVRKAFSYGVSDYISRPYDAKVVFKRVYNTIKLYTKQRRLVGLISEQIKEKEKSNNMMIAILSHIVEFRNGESGAHVVHIRLLTEKLLECLVRKTDRYQLTATDRELITTASALHDIGKIAIDSNILNKPGKFTDEEYEIMKTHTVIGAQILDKLEMYRKEPLVKIACQICRYHHERYDGKGYPEGLKGDDIPIAAQVVSVADVYDALVSKRVYKDSFSSEKAVEMIFNGECGAFNPVLLECLQEIAKEVTYNR